MAKAFLTSLTLHAAAVGLLFWSTPDAQPQAEAPQLIELQPLALAVEAPPPETEAPTAPPEVASPAPEPPPVQTVEPPPPLPEPPVQVAELPPPSEPPLSEPPLPEPPPLDLPLPEPPPEITLEDLIRSAAPPLVEAPPPPPPKPKPVPKPRPAVAKSPPAVPPPPQPITPVAQILPPPAAAISPVPPSVTPPAAPAAVPVVAAAPPVPRPPDSQYNSRLQAWIARNKPNGARVMRGIRQGMAHVEFTIDRSGQVLSRRIAQSSGSDALDQAALQWIDRANPMPPLPASYEGSDYQVVIPLNFQLQ